LHTVRRVAGLVDEVCVADSNVNVDGDVNVNVDASGTSAAALTLYKCTMSAC